MPNDRLEQDEKKNVGLHPAHQSPLRPWLLGTEHVVTRFPKNNGHLRNPSKRFPGRNGGGDDGGDGRGGGTAVKNTPKKRPGGVGSRGGGGDAAVIKEGKKTRGAGAEKKMLGKPRRIGTCYLTYF